MKKILFAISTGISVALFFYGILTVSIIISSISVGLLVFNGMISVLFNEIL